MEIYSGKVNKGVPMPDKGIRFIDNVSGTWYDIEYVAVTECCPTHDSDAYYIARKKGSGFVQLTEEEASDAVMVLNNHNEQFTKLSEERDALAKRVLQYESLRTYRAMGAMAQSEVEKTETELGRERPSWSMTEEQAEALGVEIVTVPEYTERERPKLEALRKRFGEDGWAGWTYVFDAIEEAGNSG